MKSVSATGDAASSLLLDLSEEGQGTFFVQV